MRRFLCCFLVIGLAVGIVVGQEETETPAADGIEKFEESVKKATAYLLSQQKEDGSIYDQQYQTTMTALSIIALCASGHVPSDQTKEAEAVRKALDFVLRDDRVEENGYYGNRDGSRMYGHGIVTLMLAEILGMGVDEEHDRLVRKRLEKAIELILWAEERKEQNNLGHYGGWRYQPHDGDSDLSVTIWQLLSLRAAKNAGLDVPKAAIDKAIGYLEKCYRSERDKDGKPRNLKSACGYQPGRDPSYASGAAGLLALQVCGKYDVPEVQGSTDWLKDRVLNYNEDFFFYGTYYYAQGMYQRGGEYANHARDAVEKILLEKQEKDGSWLGQRDHERNAGRVYATAMGVLSLSVRYHYLPIYQR
jgi:hypothetical protein